MKKIASCCALVLFGLTWSCLGDVQVTSERLDPGSGTFKFKDVPAPSRGDSGGKARLTILDGQRDPNGGGIEKLQDGRVPTQADEPDSNFFFQAGQDGGLLLMDLGKEIEISQVNSYSWHPAARGPQVYRLFGSDGQSSGFKSDLKKGMDPLTNGWKEIAAVDTRPKTDSQGGQYGVKISDPSGLIGKYRYLLFAVSRTESSDGFGNTFYSEIDVIDKNGSSDIQPAATEKILNKFDTAAGKYHFILDSTAAPDLTTWAVEELAPVIREWYPRLVGMLPGEGFVPTSEVTILFREGMGGTPASAGGGRINCNIDWFRKNLKGEAKGSVVHEMVHIVQQYSRRPQAGFVRPPGWLVEGIPDYLRWFRYEPAMHGAEITKRNFERAKYDASYRITANFLNWATDKYDHDLVRKLNEVARQGKYNEEVWKNITGKSVEELGQEWKDENAKRLEIQVKETLPGKP
ncbi:MAG: basic secretory protein [Verrucomicrobiales bacterium]|nr:basic secretory protein [Verrucomicrobiales bacterium]